MWDAVRGRSSASVPLAHECPDQGETPVSTMRRPLTNGLRGILLGILGWALPPSGAIAVDAKVYSQTFDAQAGASFPEWYASRVRYSSKFNPPGSGSLAPLPITCAGS